MNIQGLPALDTSVYPSTVTTSGLTRQALTSSAPAASGVASPSSTSSATGTGLNSELSPSTFLQLLATELQNQDPTNPVDPTQFMGELVQFGSYDELVNIYNLLAQASTPTAQASSPAASSNSPASSVQAHALRPIER